MRLSNVWPTQHVRHLKGVNEQSAGAVTAPILTNLSYALERMYDKSGLIRISQAKRCILPWLLYVLNRRRNENALGRSHGQQHSNRVNWNELFFHNPRLDIEFYLFFPPLLSK